VEKGIVVIEKSLAWQETWSFVKNTLPYSSETLRNMRAGLIWRNESVFLTKNRRPVWF
jgi:hypothetical protein